jgi:uncharacterized glyoxalase superfamily protein PhnB
MKIDALSVTSSNLRTTVAFYTLLGFTFPDFADDEDHIEPVVTDGSVRLMIDSKFLVQSITGVLPVPPTHSSFAIKCESPDEVNATVQKIKESGYTIIKEPWDAFWGQRYAIVADPEGYMIDLFAPLS